MTWASAQGNDGASRPLELLGPVKSTANTMLLLAIEPSPTYGTMVREFGFSLLRVSFRFILPGANPTY
jgi:hypothetical protein